MKASIACLTLIKKFEGFRARPYLCPAGVATVGYGSTFYADGRPVKLSDPLISQADAELLLRATLGQYEAAVSEGVSVPLTQWQFDALVDFAYNCGAGNFRSSTLRKKINAGDMTGASLEFARWNKANGVVLPGLVRRREAERVLFVGVRDVA